MSVYEYGQCKCKMSFIYNAMASCIRNRMFVDSGVDEIY